jgi:general secretion pathway protein J
VPQRQGASGFTLVEVMIAMAVTALVAAAAYMAINAASNSSESTRQALERFERIDRVWVLLENDLRNIVQRETPVVYGPPLPALAVNFDSEYRLDLLRGGRANPLHLPRTELARVGYRLEDGVLWRDTWYDPAVIEPEDAAQQKLVDDIEDVQIRLLTPDSQSLSNGNWVDEWPGNQAPTLLPIALEITLTLGDLGEVTRLFEIVPGS